MSTLQVPIPSEHGYKIIAVAGERFKGHVSDIEFLESEKQKYKVIDRIQITKNEPMSMILTLLSTGKYLTNQEIFSSYKKSNSIYFFICEVI